MSPDALDEAIEALRVANEGDVAAARDLVRDVCAAALAARGGGEDHANAWWCAATYACALGHYLDAFDHMRERAFYEGWCALERAEIELHFLFRHEVRVGRRLPAVWLDEMIELWQSLFPYRVFFSPAYLIRTRKCGICGEPMLLAGGGCGHRLGQLYGGKMCTSIVTDAEILEVSVVPNPAQKYSVAFLTDESGQRRDQHDYTLVEYVVERLPGPFADWDVEVTRRKYDVGRFSDRTAGDPCPCSSGRPFEQCCLSSGAVELDHYDIAFGFPVEDTVDDLLVGTTKSGGVGKAPTRV